MGDETDIEDILEDYTPGEGNDRTCPECGSGKVELMGQTLDMPMRPPTWSCYDCDHKWVMDDD